MHLLLSVLWPGLAGASALGLVLGRMLPSRGRFVPAGLGLALIGLAGLAVTGVVPGAAGLWLESAALMLAAYLTGCALGRLSRRIPIPRV